MIWIVTLKRFLQEFHNHIRGAENKHINWFVDVNGFIRLYIEQTHGNNAYCYIHQDTSETLPIELKTEITEKGMVLGVEGIEPEDYSIQDKLEEISTRLKFNMYKGDKG